MQENLDELAQLYKALVPDAPKLFYFRSIEHANSILLPLAKEKYEHGSAAEKKMAAAILHLEPKRTSKKA